MKEFKGTKGEWNCTKKEGYDYDIYSGELEICTTVFSDIRGEEARLNAQLIATAPELLQELKKIKLDIDLGIIRVSKTSPIYKGIEQAINKALGL